MPPKKRDKEAESVKNLRVDQIQADHESFLQAFESKFSCSFIITYKMQISMHTKYFIFDKLIKCE